MYNGGIVLKITSFSRKDLNIAARFDIQDSRISNIVALAVVQIF
jgi:hypothetical protein